MHGQRSKQNIWDVPDIDGNDEDADEQVSNRHERHDHLGRRSDALNSTENHHCRQGSHEQSHDHLGDGALQTKGVIDGLNYRVGLHRVVYESVGDSDGHAEDDSQPTGVHAAGHVVSRHRHNHPFHHGT